jgi:hypothetical protein
MPYALCDHLKKQSQFVSGQFDVKSYSKGAYACFCGFGQRKNKAKQSQFAGRLPEILSAKL